MSKTPIPDNEPPIDKAAERLKQFENARKPPEHENDRSDDQEGEADNEERGDSNEKPDR
jgi:hypothetical protein